MTLESQIKLAIGHFEPIILDLVLEPLKKILNVPYEGHVKPVWLLTRLRKVVYRKQR